MEMDAEHLIKAYMNGELEQLKRGRYIDAFDQMAHVSQAVKTVKRKVTVTQQGFWNLEETDAENPQNAQDQQEAAPDNQNNPGRFMHIRGNLTLLQEIKRSCQKSFQQH